MMGALGIRVREVLAARHEPEAQSRLASRYWLFLLAFFFCIALAGVGYGAWEFTQPLGVKVESESVIVARPKAPLNQAELREVLDGFDARALLFEERQSAPSVPDPS